ncbi:MAG: recombinase family protein [Patescibacteria group bacterium]
MRYIIYARKSTEDEDRQILSIEAQLVELREFAAKEKLKIVASLCEAKTAKEPGRTKFAEMLKQIEQGKADGILSWHPDRLARNSVDGGRIIHMIDKGLIKSLKFPTFWFEPTPQGLFMLNIAFGQSKYFVDNLRENTKRGLRQKIRNGVWPGWAPVGYLNNSKTKMIDIDPEKAPKVRKLFELYATGNHTFHSLANWCKEQKLKGNLGKEISTSNIPIILQNIFYIGLMKWKGEIFEGKHKPLITKKLFDNVQETLKQRGRAKEIKSHYFPFAGLMKCGSCSCGITAEIQKDHNYYRCTKKKNPCPEKYLREEVLIKQIKIFFQKVSLSNQDTKKVLAELEKDEQQAKEQAKIVVQNLKEEILRVEKELERLLDVYLKEVISTEEYTAKKQKLLTKKVELQEKIRDFEQKGLSWREPAREFVLKLNYAQKLLASENYAEMSTFLKNIGSNHILQNQKLSFSWKIPFNLAAEPRSGEAETLTFPRWLPGLDSNQD